VHTEFSWGSNHLKDQGVDGWIILKMAHKEVCWRAWTGLISLRIETFGGLL
jgi:hypothetical protein